MSVDAQLTLTMKEIERYQEEIILLEQETLSSKEACEKSVNTYIYNLPLNNLPIASLRNRSKSERSDKLTSPTRSLIIYFVFAFDRLLESIASTPERFGVPDDNPWQRAATGGHGCQCTIM